MPDMWIDVDTAVEVFVNTLALKDSTDFVTTETGIVYNQAGMDLRWNFETSAGVVTQTAVTPTTAGDYDWTHVGGGMYKIEIPATGGASINNDTEGTGWFTGECTGVLSWASPRYGFRAAALNNALIDGGDLLDVNITQISGDTTAADNLELQYDTTGLAGGTFPATQDQLAGLPNTGSASNKVFTGEVLTTPATTTGGSYTDTAALDGVYMYWDSVSGGFEAELTTNIGAGSPSGVKITGYITGLNDAVRVQIWDAQAGTPAWVTVGTWNGKGGATNEVLPFDAFITMVGTGANLGDIRLRLYNDNGVSDTALTNANIYIDQVFVEFNQGSSGYENGRVWINTSISNTGTIPGVDGVATNPVSTLAAAKTLSGTTQLTDFHMINGSSITFTANSDNESYFGDNWALDLGGQSCVDIQIVGAEVTGTGTAASGEMHFDGCDLTDVTGQLMHGDFCGFIGTTTHTLAGDYNYHNCYSKVAGAGAPTFTKTAGQTITLQYRNWAGGITLSGLEAGDVVTVGGTLGTVTLNGADASVEIRGTYKNIVNNLTGSPTVNSDGALQVDDIVDKTWDEVLTGGTHNISNSSGKRLRDLQEFGSYEGGAIFIDTINGAGGTTDYESGTILNPVDGMADANTLAASLTLSRFEVAPGSSITLTASQTDQVFRGVGYSLALGGQDVSESEFIGAQSVTGTATSPAGEVHFVDCEFVSGSLGQAHLKFCGLGGTLTLTAAANYTLSDCYSQVPGSPTPIIDFGAAVGNTGLSMRRYSGGVEVRNYGATGTDTMSLEGNGQLVIAASCTGGTIYVRGNFKVTDNSGGAVAVVYDDNTQNTADILDDTGTSGVVITQASADKVWASTTRTLTDGVQKNQAFSNLEFLMVLASDHVTPAPGIVVTGERSIDGAPFGPISGSISEVGSGIYKVNLLAADTNGDVITYKFSNGTADDTHLTVTTS